MLDVEAKSIYTFVQKVGEGIMARTMAEDRAIKKYEKEKIDKILLRVPKGKKELIQECAAQNGESVNAFINHAVDAAMLKGNQK